MSRGIPRKSKKRKPQDSRNTQEPEVLPTEGGHHRLVAASRTLTIGPLPPAAELEHYNQVFPGCAERIVSMAERQAEHRQYIEKEVVEANCNNERRGQIFAFILSIMLFGIGAFLFAINKAGIATAVIGGDAFAVVGLFVYSKESQKQERRDKERQQKDQLASVARSPFRS